MMFVLTMVATFLLLVGSEVWWRKRKPHDEFSRKFVHITVGTLAALWPFYMSWRQIALLSAAFVIVITLSKYFNIFRAIHAVQRPTWGEICFAVAVGTLSIITHDKWIYAAALLHMSLADGFAAIVGTQFGHRNGYTIWGHTKSLAGTATFFALSIVILTLYSNHSGHPLSVAFMLPLAFVATFIENVGVQGLDNILVPLWVAYVLVHLQ